MGGASGVVALRRAARAIQAGDANLIACIGADTNHVDTFRNTIATFSQFANDAVYPYGSGGPNSSFAFLTDYYMREFGVSREDFGKLCIAQRRFRSRLFGSLWATLLLLAAGAGVDAAAVAPVPALLATAFSPFRVHFLHG